MVKTLVRKPEFKLDTGNFTVCYPQGGLMGDYRALVGKFCEGEVSRDTCEVIKKGDLR